MNLYEKLKPAEKLKLDLDLSDLSENVQIALKGKPFVMNLTIAEAFDLQNYFIGSYNLDLNELYNLFK